jgi:hypothetical protein
LETVAALDLDKCHSAAMSAPAVAASSCCATVDALDTTRGGVSRCRELLDRTDCERRRAASTPADACVGGGSADMRVEWNLVLQQGSLWQAMRSIVQRVARSRICEIWAW